MIKKKILIIDDEKDFTRLVKINLEKSGKYEVMTENRSVDALSTVKKCRPDLVLLDILMPDKSGDEIAFEMRNDEYTKDIPIVFLTAVAGQIEVSSRGGFIGGYPFIAKPVTDKELINIIEENIK